MADVKLIEYIKASRLSGRTDQEIKKTLTDIGWTEGPVDEALKEADSQSHPTSSTPVATETSNIYSSETPTESQGTGRGRLFLLLATVGLLLIFAIIGAFMALRGTNSPATSQQSSNQRDQQRQSDIKSYSAALGKYFSSNSRYPAVSGQGPDSTNSSSTGVFDGSGALKSYQSNFPQDPKNGETLCRPNASMKEVACAYKYRVSADGKKYVIWAVLENSYNNEGVYTINTAGQHSLVSSEPNSVP